MLSKKIVGRWSPFRCKTSFSLFREKENFDFVSLDSQGKVKEREKVPFEITRFGWSLESPAWQHSNPHSLILSPSLSLSLSLSLYQHHLQAAFFQSFFLAGLQHLSQPLAPRVWRVLGFFFPSILNHTKRFLSPKAYFTCCLSSPFTCPPFFRILIQKNITKMKKRSST